MKVLLVIAVIGLLLIAGCAPTTTVHSTPSAPAEQPTQANPPPSGSQDTSGSQPSGTDTLK